MGMLGCGVQGRTNLKAVKVAFPKLSIVSAYDIDSKVLARYAKDMEKEHGVKVIPASSPRKAVEGSDIVVTAGPILKHPSPVIEPSWFKKGGFACPLDFDSYWRNDAMQSVDKFCTDDKNQLEYYKTVGYFGGIPKVHADLGEIVTARKRARENDDERIISMNLGVAIEDMATAIRIFERAKTKGVGTWVSL
jgi:ornithine cyclodeaminase/alanine dehydrogenase